jgi:hypothetical protein
MSVLLVFLLMEVGICKMRSQVFCCLVVCTLVVLEFSGCSAIGYAIGRGMDPADTTYSIRQNDLNQYVGEKVTILTEDKKTYNGELLAINPTSGKGDALVLRNIYLFKSFTYSKGYREESDLSFTEDQLRDVLITEKRSSNRYIFGGIGLAIDVAAVIVAIEFSNTWNGWGRGIK